MHYRYKIISKQGNKYQTISFRYSNGKETRLFPRNDPPPLKKKAGFLRYSQKKRCIKNF
ncbi:Uncharacterized protein dnm_009970 [Desulfonema magnum]|uniref:Uncharacterized protein n=1 Tax=Desulfonema magnum TaxID=45655 RepID=A0A975BGR2_9BACT|nr:Uncharacterized protein dnm_009970 [Desulfonema magnum]